MPYFYDPNLDPNQQQQNQMGQNAQTAGGSSIAGGTVNAAGTSGTQSGPTSSGRFQNLQDYLNANQNSGFAGQFAGKVNSDVNQAGDSINQASQQFQQRSDQGTVNEDPNLTSQALSNPSGFVSDPNNLSAFQKMRDANYSGPNSFSDLGDSYSKAASATQKSQDVSQAYDNEGGRFALLDQYFGRPDYQQGEKSLDNLLIQNDPSTAQSIQTAKQNAANMQTAFQNAGASASDYAAKNRGTTEKTRNDTRSALGMDDAGNLSDSSPLLQKEKGIQQQVTDRENQIAQENAQYLKDLTGATGTSTDPIKAGVGPMLTPNQTTSMNVGGQLTPGTTFPSATYGLDPNAFKTTDESSYFAGKNIAGLPTDYNRYLTPYSVTSSNNFYGVDPTKYLTQGDVSQINPTSITSADDAATIRALEQLSNQPDNFFDPNVTVGSQIGKGDPAFDSAGFTKAVGQNQTAMDADLKQAIDNWVSQANGGQLAYSLQPLFQAGNDVRSKYGLNPLAFT